MAIPSGQNNQLNNTIVNALNNAGNFIKPSYSSNTPSLGAFAGIGANVANQQNMSFAPNMSVNPTPNVYSQPVVNEADKIRQLQIQLNAQNAGKNGWTPLATDGVMGPKTQAAINFKPTNPGIVSSSTVRNDVQRMGSDLDRMVQDDPYMQILQNRLAQLSAFDPDATGADEQRAAANAGRAQDKIARDNAAYQAGIRTLGLQTGLSRNAPQLVQDQLMRAKIAESQSLMDLQEEEDIAIAKAKQARIENNAQMLKDALDQVRDIRKAKQDELEFQLAERKLNFEMSKARSAGSGSSGIKYTNAQLLKLRAAGIDPEDTEVADALLSGAIEPSRGTVGATMKITKRFARKALELGANLDIDATTIQDALAEGYPIEYIGVSLGYSPEAIEFLKRNVE